MTAHIQFTEAAPDLSAYVRDISRYPLLSASEELETARRIGDARQAYCRQMLSNPLVQQECRKSLLKVQRRDCRIDTVVDVAVGDKEKTREARRLIDAALPKLTDSTKIEQTSVAKIEANVNLLASLHLRVALVARHWEDVGQSCCHVEELNSDLLQLQQKLVRHNLRLVLSLASKYQPAGSGLLDLIQDGNIGLMIAAEKFDAKRGYRFSTYATWWIREMMRRGIRANGRTIRITDTGREFQLRFGRRIEELRQKSGYLNCELIDREVSLGIEDRQALRAMQPITSLNNSLVRDDPIIHVQRDQTVTTPVDQASKNETARSVYESLASHVHRDREVIMMRFGLNGRDEHTFDQIAAELSMSRQGVAKVAKRVLNNLASQLGQT